MTSTLDRASVGDKPPKVDPRRRHSGRLRRRSFVVTAVVTVVVALAVAATLVLMQGGGAAKVEGFALPSSYHVTYTVATSRPDDHTTTVSTEQVWVRRPFDSVDITYAGSSADANPSLVVVYRLGVQVLKASNAEAGLLHVPASAAPQDVRADVVVPAALHTHKMRVVGHAVLLGRPCQIFRTATSLRTGPLPTRRTSSTYVDTCIDAAGIVLRETQVVAGQVVSDRRAVQVQTGDPAVAGAPFEMTGTATPFDSGGGAFTPLTLTSRPPGRSWAIAALPAGFEHLGRFAVVPPQPQLFGQGGNGYGSMGLPGGLVTEMDDVYVRGADVVVLQQGSTLNGATFSLPPNGLSVDLGRLGRGELLLGGAGTTVVAEPGNGKGFVRLSATLPVDQTVALMRALAAQPGGTLTRLHSTTDSGAAS